MFYRFTIRECFQLSGQKTPQIPPISGHPSLTTPAPPQVTVVAKPLHIAVITSRPPLPMTRADQMTVAHWLAFLSARGHAVELFALHDAPIEAAASAWLNDHCHAVHWFHRPRWRGILGEALGWLQGLPLQVGLFQHGPQTAAIRAAADRFDLLYVYYIRSAEAVRGLRSPPRVLAMQLSQTLNIERMLANFRTRRERWLYRLELPRVRAYEARAWQRFTQTVLIGQADLYAVEAACAKARQPQINNAVLIPHGADLSIPPADPAMQEPATVLFLGVLATNTNVEAVLWFCREVWPLVRRTRPNARFLVLGRRPRAVIQALDAVDGVEIVGEVDDPAPYLARAAVAVYPVKAGAGMQNKLLDYAAAGKAIVATTIANEGIGLPPGDAALIADSPQDFAAAVISLMDDQAERRRLGQAARDFVEAGWSWEAWFLRLEATLYETAGIEP